VKRIPTHEFYNEVANTYSWHQVAERTERVYDFVMDKPAPNMLNRIKSGVAWGPMVGLWALFYMMIEVITLWLIELFLPEEDIDIVRSFDAKMYNSVPVTETFGDH